MQPSNNYFPWNYVLKFFSSLNAVTPPFVKGQQQICLIACRHTSAWTHTSGLFFIFFPSPRLHYSAFFYKYFNFKALNNNKGIGWFKHDLKSNTKKHLNIWNKKVKSTVTGCVRHAHQSYSRKQHGLTRSRPSVLCFYSGHMDDLFKPSCPSWHPQRSERLAEQTLCLLSTYTACCCVFNVSAVRERSRFDSMILAYSVSMNLCLQLSSTCGLLCTTLRHWSRGTFLLLRQPFLSISWSWEQWALEGRIAECSFLTNFHSLYSRAMCGLEREGERSFANSASKTRTALAWCYAWMTD